MMRVRSMLNPMLAAWAVSCGSAWSTRLAERVESAHLAFLENRRAALPALSDPFGVPPVARMVVEDPAARFRHLPGWRRGIVSTVFWVGEAAGENNPVPNTVSAWDGNWQANFGGYDDPGRRRGYLPAGFVPALNPFYVALPYNDLARGGGHRPEAAEVIPWFWRDYRGDGISVCKGRWLAIHSDGKICFAQWEDVGPFEVDHWQYVFGKENPRPNRNGNAGIDLSPAVRDYLGLRSGQRVDWRFADEREVPSGPWRNWGAVESPLPVEPPLPVE